MADGLSFPLRVADPSVPGPQAYVCVFAVLWYLGWTLSSSNGRYGIKAADRRHRYASRHQAPDPRPWIG
jgi:hypothetical protein